jgi:ComF family protein
MSREYQGGSLSRFLEAALGVLFPNRCSICNSDIDVGCCVCKGCLRKIEIIHPPFCKRCGAPSRGGAPLARLHPEGSCIQCADLIFHFAKNESLGVYSGILRELIHSYKFEKRRGLARTFSSLIREYKRGYVEQHEVIVPVPLTPSRLSERGFNQASLIAEQIAKESSIVLAEECLSRRGNSKPQSRIGAVAERLANLKDRFTVRERYRDAIRKRSVLVFDDVLTTGATSSACARALMSAGAALVDVLTIARAVKD